MATELFGIDFRIGYGLIVALVVGQLVTWGVHRLLTWSANLDERPPGKRVPGSVTGTFERLLTFALVASQFPEFQNVVLAWLAAKLAANWQRDEPTGKAGAQQEYRTRALIAVMSGIVSVSFGYLGGRIAAH
ncbi:MAG: hypothetical protein E5X42_30580 [Mesorhizobium sp.]|nr:MAG: hypothetical protein E5X42_30580 [Mesorhizobium sp.]